MLMNCSTRIDGVTIVFSFSVCGLLRFKHVLSHILIHIVKRFHVHAKVFFYRLWYLKNVDYGRMTVQYKIENKILHRNVNNKAVFVKYFQYFWLIKIFNNFRKQTGIWFYEINNKKVFSQPLLFWFPMIKSIHVE